MSELLGRMDDLLRRFVSAWWGPLAVFLGGVAVYSARLGNVDYSFDDTRIHVPAALFYRWGQSGPDNWWGPPLKYLLLRASMLVGGNDGVGWRVLGVLFGAGIATMVFLIARRAFGDHRVVVAATALTALDPVIVVFSRGTTEEVPSVFFALAAIVLWLRAREGDRVRDWVGAGVLLGLAVSAKWSAVAVGAAILALSLAARPRDARRASMLVGALALVPLAVYVATYLPWFTRGYSLSDLLTLHLDSTRVQSIGMWAPYGPMVPSLGRAGWWMVDFVGTVYARPLPSSLTVYQAVMNDPVLWVLFVPCSLYLAWWGWKKRRGDWLLLGALFPAMYTSFVTAPRPMLIYSGVTIVPFGFLAVAFTAVRLLKRRAWVAIAPSVAWSLYLLPLTLGIPVFEWTHGWVTSALVFKGAP